MRTKKIRKIEIYNVGEFKKLARGKDANILMTILSPKSYFTERVYLDHISIIYIQSNTAPIEKVIVKMEPYQEGIRLTFLDEEGSISNHSTYLGTDLKMYSSGLCFQHCSKDYNKLKISLG